MNNFVQDGQELFYPKNSTQMYCEIVHDIDDNFVNRKNKSYFKEQVNQTKLEKVF